jgi:hypothetical protein
MQLAITLNIEIPEPLQTLLQAFLGTLAATAPARSSPEDVPAERPMVGPAAPAAHLDVSSLNSPAAASPPPALTAKSHGGGGRALYRTQERIDFLKLAWPRGDGAADVLATMNKLPGPAVADERTVLRMVAWLKLQRSPEALRRMQMAKVRAMRDAKVKGEPVPASHDAILRWGAEHGCHQDQLDLAAMNARRRELGLPPFVPSDARRRAA